MGLLSGLQTGFLRLHQAAYEGTRGAIGHRTIGVPSLLLTSVGRRSGQARTAALIYAKDGDSYVVTASNSGADAPPGWLFNVKADPSVDVRVGRRRFAALADVVGPEDPRYGALWNLVNRRNLGRYRRYQTKTTRPIELVRLTPA